ncbi:hypothetical protein THERMOT_480 [Bathymodiolus thermophilus thioautotrophic gill symbiont]|uniref:hypothetical protein n=1 Tax=Bathymodiolus thermophilus thioautotrophic gill symbiont TaxID=2360 RepID=UPI00192AED29|nr:hypothetical protein [Bathymodiolus thermophilus thioautotrophic gill symbiont]CAB5496241.1 hypothetical protein THERMOT_480 [Bathymodiolus thermophilus thioautotrophic gill symbiont]
MTIINLSAPCIKTAKLSGLKDYIQNSTNQAGKGKHIILAGVAPAWLYLSITHALHGKAKILQYQSLGLIDNDKNPEGVMTIFNHNAY